jgi:[acyl-carrier-protein] S-malonyltransferase
MHFQGLFVTHFLPAFVFPGYGCQHAGMGKDIAANFPAARRAFDEVDDALQFSLSAMLFADREVNNSALAMCGVLATSVAIARTLQSEGLHFTKINPIFAGHSFGELSAVCSAEMASVGELAKTTREIVDIMQSPSQCRPGSMAVFTKIRGKHDSSSVKDECDDIINVVQKRYPSNVCVIGNDNTESQVVISGDRDSVHDFVTIATSRGFFARIIAKNLADHSPLAVPASRRVFELMQTTIKAAPHPFRLIPNGTAILVNNPTPRNVVQMLSSHRNSRVRWRETMLELGNLGTTHLIECGPRRPKSATSILCSFAAQTTPNIKRFSLATASDIREFLKTPVAQIIQHTSSLKGLDVA